MFECCRCCTERFVGCHSTCERYIEDKKKWESVKQAKQRENELRDIRYRGIFAQARKTRFYYSKGMKWKF